MRLSSPVESARTHPTCAPGSGTDNSDLQKAITAGINIIDINTELRVAWRHGLEDAFARNPYEIVPYKLLPPAEESVKQVVLERLRLFNQQHRQPRTTPVQPDSEKIAQEQRI